MTTVASANQAVVQGLQPAKLWSFFASLSELPRPSKHEQRQAHT